MTENVKKDVPNTNKINNLISNEITNEKLTMNAMDRVKQKVLFRNNIFSDGTFIIVFIFAIYELDKKIIRRFIIAKTMNI